MQMYFDGNPILQGSGGGGGGVPKGTIVLWSGTEEDIPSGWALCNGENGTPDLRDKFVLGAGETHPVGEGGGAEKVTLVANQVPSHYHNVNVQDSSGNTGSSGVIMADGIGSTTVKNKTVVTSYTNGNPSYTTQPHNNMPPYYALCYIMCISGSSGGSGVDSSPAQNNTYSTEETVVGTWVDGKPIYRRVYTYTCSTTTGSNATRYVPNTKQTDLSLDTICFLYGLAKMASDNRSHPLIANKVNNASTLLGVEYSPTGGIGYTSISSTTSITYTAHVVIEYTKTTDEGGAS